MPRPGILPLSASILLVVTAMLSISAARSADAQSAPHASAAILHATHASPSDLEVGGELADLPPGSTRYALRALTAYFRSFSQSRSL